MVYISDCLCNGTRLKMIKVDKAILHCEILTGDKKDNIAHIPRKTLETSGRLDIPFISKIL